MADGFSKAHASRLSREVTDMAHVRSQDGAARWGIPSHKGGMAPKSRALN